jgi:foldase protein PrsA
MAEEFHANEPAPSQPVPGPAAAPPAAFDPASITTGNATKKPRWALYAMGTAAIIIAGGILFQLSRAKEGEAASNDTGRVKVSDPSGRNQSVARVGDRLITEAQLVAELKERHGIEVLDKIINRTLIQQACERRNIQVTDAEVEGEIKKIAGQFNLDVANWYKMIEAERGLSQVQYQRDVIWPMLALRKLAGKRLQITEADIQKEYIRSYTPRAKVRMILLDNARRAREVWEKVKRNPKQFEHFVSEYSIDANSRPLGGVVPPIPRYSGNEKLEEAAFGLRIGEISSVVQIGLNRFVILKGEGRTQSLDVKQDEVRDDIIEELRRHKEREMAAVVFEELKREIHVDNFLTHVSTGPRRTASNRSARR